MLVYRFMFCIFQTISASIYLLQTFFSICQMGYSFFYLTKKCVFPHSPSDLLIDPLLFLYLPTSSYSIFVIWSQLILRGYPTLSLLSSYYSALPFRLFSLKATSNETHLQKIAQTSFLSVFSSRFFIISTDRAQIQNLSVYSLYPFESIYRLSIHYSL